MGWPVKQRGKGNLLELGGGHQLKDKYFQEVVRDQTGTILFRLSLYLRNMFSSRSCLGLTLLNLTKPNPMLIHASPTGSQGKLLPKKGLFQIRTAQFIFPFSLQE